MRETLIIAALTGLATGIGALPFLFVRTLPRRVYDGVLGLGAGLMLAAATLGLLSHALEGVQTPSGVDVGQLLMVVMGFSAGAGIAALMDRLIPHRHARGHLQHIGAHHHTPEPEPGPAGETRRMYMIVGALSLHRLPEGLAIGAGFAASETHHLGLLLATAIALQNVCEGVVMGAPLRAVGVSPFRGLLVVLLTGLTMPLGAFVGHLASVVAVPAMPFVLALAGGTLIYVTSNEIIPESHSHGSEGTASAGVVAGFLLTLVISAVLH